MSEPIDATAVQNDTAEQPVPAEQPTAEITPAEEFSAGVRDFEKAFEYVTAGVEAMGDAAKSELIALAKKFL